MKGHTKMFLYFALSFIADLIIGLQILINPELITEVQLSFIGYVFLAMATKSFLIITAKFTNDKIEQYGE